MLMRTFCSLVVLCVASTSFAQGVSKENYKGAPQADSSVSAQGLRVAFVKPVLTLKVKATLEGYGSNSNSEKIDEANGVSIGYAHLPVGRPGFTTNFALINLKEKGDDSASFLRIDGNLAYAVNQTVSFKGGLNIATVNKSEFRKTMEPGIGVQASVGLQLNKNIGIDAGFVQMRQNSKGRYDKIKISAQETGPELALTGTF